MTYKMERSPFYKQRKEKPLEKDIKGRVSFEVYQELETLFNVHYGDRSSGVREVLMDFLNNICQERKYFRNLQAIILTPRSFNPDELNEKAHVIGFIEGEHDAINPSFFIARAQYSLKLKHICAFMEFNEDYYNALELNRLDKSVLFDIDRKTQNDFESVKKRLSELYGEDIDIDDAYFSTFNLNNYLDIEDKGVFHSKSSTYSHEGALVLLTDFNHIVCARLKWSHAQGVFSLDMEFHQQSHYINEMMIELHKNGYEYKYLNISETVTQEESLKRKIQSYDLIIDRYTKRRERAQKRLDEIENDS